MYFLKRKHEAARSTNGRRPFKSFETLKNKGKLCESPKQGEIIYFFYVR